LYQVVTDNVSKSRTSLSLYFYDIPIVTKCHRCYAELESKKEPPHCRDCEVDLKEGYYCDVCNEPKFLKIWDSFFQYQVNMMYEGIEILFEKKKGLQLCALALVTYTEVMGGLVTGKLKKKDATRENFEAFLPYLGQEYVKLAGKFNIYGDVRSKLVHEFSPRPGHGIFLSEKPENEKIGLEYINDFLNFNLQEYFRDFKKGVQLYRLKLEKEKEDKKLLGNFLKSTVNEPQEYKQFEV